MLRNVYTLDSDGRARCVTFSDTRNRNWNRNERCCTYARATIDGTRILHTHAHAHAPRIDRWTTYVHCARVDRRERRRRRTLRRQAWHRASQARSTALPPPRGCESSARAAAPPSRVAGCKFRDDWTRGRRVICQLDAVILSSVKVVVLTVRGACYQDVVCADRRVGWRLREDRRRGETRDLGRGWAGLRRQSAPRGVCYSSVIVYKLSME